MSDDLIREARELAEVLGQRMPEYVEQHCVMPPDRPALDAAQCLTALADELEAARAQCGARAEWAIKLSEAEVKLEAARGKETAIRDNIPMSFLRAADVPGAAGPTEHLDLVKAIRLMTEKSRECATRVQAAEAQAERLAEMAKCFTCDCNAAAGLREALAAYKEWRDGQG